MRTYADEYSVISREEAHRALRYFYAEFASKHQVLWRGEVRAQGDHVVAIVTNGPYVRKHVVCVDQSITIEYDELPAVNATAFYDVLVARHGTPLPLMVATVRPHAMGLIMLYGIIKQNEVPQ